MLSKTLIFLKKEDPPFFEALQAQKGLLIYTARRIARLTSCEEEDVLSDIMVALVEVRKGYSTDQYKYNNRTYEIADRDHSLVLLRTPEKNKRKKSMWVQNIGLKPLRKNKLEAMLCKEISQQNSDMLTAHYCQKRGYLKKSDRERYIFRRNWYSVRSKEGDIFVLGCGVRVFGAKLLRDTKSHSTFKVLDGNNKGEILKMRKCLVVQRRIQEVSVFSFCSSIKDTVGDKMCIFNQLRSSENSPEDRVIAKDLYEKGLKV